MIENIKARFNCKKFNIWTEKEDANRKKYNLLAGDYVYNGTLYYGNRFFIFFRSGHNSWYESNI